MNRHVARELRRQLRESGAAGLVAVLMVTATTALGGTLWAVRQWVRTQLLAADRPAAVVATLRDPASSAELAAQLGRRFPGLRVEARSRAAVRDELASWFPEFGATIQALEEASFPALLEVTVSPSAIDDIAAWLRVRPEVVLVQSSKAWQERVSVVLSRVFAAGFTFALGLLAGCGVVVLLVIRLLVLDHTDEIVIMRLIGAHEAAIRLPYLFCGAVLGIAGGFLGVGLLVLVSVLLRPLLPGTAMQPGFLAVLPVLGGGVGGVGAALGLAALPDEP